MNDLDICNGTSTSTDEIDCKFEKNANDQRSLAERMPWNNAVQFIHDLDDVPIEQLALSARPHNALRRNRITTIGQVLQLTANKLIGLITMGERSASEVLVKLCQYPENRISIFNKPSEPVTSDDAIDWKHVKKVNDSCSLAERISWHGDSAQKQNLQNEAIEKLALSVRPYNALLRHGITTIGEVMQMHLSEIIDLPNLGETSATEIALSLNRFFLCKPIMDVPAQPHLAQTQQTGVRYIDVRRFSCSAPTAQTTLSADVPIEQLRMSARAYNCLFRAGYKTLQPLLNIPKENRLEELKKIRNVGLGTAEELLALLEKLVDLRQTATEEVADNKVALCHYIRIFNSDGTSCDWRLSNDVFRQLFEEHRSSIADMLGFVSSQNDAIQQITEYPQIDKLFFDDAFLASAFYQSVQSAINQYAQWEYGAQLQFWPVLNANLYGSSW